MSRESRTAPIKNFTDLTAWQEARALAVLVYRQTHDFPVEERYGLQGQLRRAANSCAANIAEGFGRETPKDRAHFYQLALGSLRETQSHSVIAMDVDLLTKAAFEKISIQTIRTQRLLSGLIASTRKRSHDSRLTTPHREVRDE